MTACQTFGFPGGNTVGATPLPIPNRVVKPYRANGTVLATVRESRSSPGFLFVRNPAEYRSGAETPGRAKKYVDKPGGGR